MIVPDLGDGAVTLRHWRAADAPVLAAAWTDPDVVAGSTPPEDRSVDAATIWIEGTWLREEAEVAVDLVVADMVDDRALGEVGVSSIDNNRRAALIGWWVSADHRGHHVASRAVRLFADWLLDPGPLDHLLAEIEPANRASVRVAFNAGFSLLEEFDDDRPSVFVRHRNQSR